MKAIDIIVLLAVAAALALAIASMWRRRGRGCGNCRACDGWKSGGAQGCGKRGGK